MDCSAGFVYCGVDVRIPMLNGMIPLLVLVGPTSVGKTELSLHLAARLGAEIVSADSRYLYRGLDIGTAKPGRTELARIPHHLVDVTAPDQPWSLAEYKRAAVAAIADIYARGRLPLLVGGTGQYVRALLEGWQIPAGGGDLQLRARLTAQAETAGGLAALYAQLTELDAGGAVQIDARNPRRVVRALEVCLTTGRPFSAQRMRLAPAYGICQIGLTLPRAELYARIDARVDQMLNDGLLAETQRLAAQGLAWDLPALSALGYRQLGAHLRGECSLAEAVLRIKHDTRRFSRRQYAWFSLSNAEITWFDVVRTPRAQIEQHVVGALQKAGYEVPAGRIGT